MAWRPPPRNTLMEYRYSPNSNHLNNSTDSGLSTQLNTPGLNTSANTNKQQHTVSVTQHQNHPHLYQHQQPQQQQYPNYSSQPPTTYTQSLNNSHTCTAYNPVQYRAEGHTGTQEPLNNLHPSYNQTQYRPEVQTRADQQGGFGGAGTLGELRHACARVPHDVPLRQFNTHTEYRAGVNVQGRGGYLPSSTGHLPGEGVLPYIGYRETQRPAGLQASGTGTTQVPNVGAAHHTGQFNNTRSYNNTTTGGASHTNPRGEHGAQDRPNNKGLGTRIGSGLGYNHQDQLPTARASREFGITQLTEQDRFKKVQERKYIGPASEKGTNRNSNQYFNSQQTFVNLGNSIPQPESTGSAEGLSSSVCGQGTEWRRWDNPLVPESGTGCAYTAAQRRLEGGQVQQHEHPHIETTLTKGAWLPSINRPELPSTTLNRQEGRPAKTDSQGGYFYHKKEKATSIGFKHGQINENVPVDMEVIGADITGVGRKGSGGVSSQEFGVLPGENIPENYTNYNNSTGSSIIANGQGHFYSDDYSRINYNTANMPASVSGGENTMTLRTVLAVCRDSSNFDTRGVHSPTTTGYDKAMVNGNNIQNQQNTTRRVYRDSIGSMNGECSTYQDVTKEMTSLEQSAVPNGNLQHLGDNFSHSNHLDPPQPTGTPSKSPTLKLKQFLKSAFWGQQGWLVQRRSPGGRRGYGYWVEHRFCRHVCACCRRMPRRFIRGLQWCYGYNQRQTLCWGLCDLYSIVLSVIAVLLIARDQFITHCVGVRYSSEYICSERYVSYECNFPNRDFMEDDELFSRCGVYGNGQFKPHLNNNSIETICGPNKPLIGSLRINRRNRTVLADKTYYKVPNVVHYTIDCNVSKSFDYINYLSFVSVERFVAPERIYVHCNCFLNTSWWFTTLEDVANIYVVKREFPEYIQARPPRWLDHRADVIKLQTLFHNGGIHLDLDVLLIRPVSALRVHDLVLGEQDDQGQIGDGIILSKPHDAMVCLWMNGYREYEPWPWEFRKYSTQNLKRITDKFPDKVHIVRNILLKPGPNQVKAKLHEGHYTWRRNYAVKLWRESVQEVLPNSAAEVEKLSSSLGDLLRYVGNWTKPTPPPATARPLKGPYKKGRKLKKQVKKKKRNDV